MSLYKQLINIENSKNVEKRHIVDNINNLIKINGFTVIELNDSKPWGAYFRFSNNDIHRFTEEFFPELVPFKLGEETSDIELSPKILLVSPGQRLSWQYHNRRGEIWSFLTDGAYHRSIDDHEGRKIKAAKGELVQFDVTERHRLVGVEDKYVIVAEIWRHTDHNHISDEDDIVRLQDDYNR